MQVTSTNYLGKPTTNKLVFKIFLNFYFMMQL